MLFKLPIRDSKLLIIFITNFNLIFLLLRIFLYNTSIISFSYHDVMQWWKLTNYILKIDEFHNNWINYRRFRWWWNLGDSWFSVVCDLLRWDSITPFSLIFLPLSFGMTVFPNRNLASTIQFSHRPDWQHLLDDNLDISSLAFLFFRLIIRNY